MNGYVAKSDVLSVIRILQSKMDDSGDRALENVISAVTDMVEADVVPVVRCKDCRRKLICGKGDNYFCAEGEKILR